MMLDTCLSCSELGVDARSPVKVIIIIIIIITFYASHQHKVWGGRMKSMDEMKYNWLG